MTIRRAWNGFVADGHLRDQFANAVANRIREENHDSEMAGYPPELVEDFVARCDVIFAEHGPITAEAVDALARSVETTDLYELVSNEE